jgi:phage terminase large subunit-like protein
MALRLEAWKDYAAGSAGRRFEAWCAQQKLGKSQWAGQTFVLERDWQAPIMFEALAIEANGDPYWKTIAIIVPRKNAKTTTLGAFADYSLDEGVGEPEILLAAASDKQAGRLFGASVGFARRNPSLDARRGGSLIVREYVGEIARADGGGKIIRLSSEGDTQHGADPSKVIIDELQVWRMPKHKRSWGALTTADGARTEAQVFTITTEGEAAGREESILGQLVDENEAQGVLEVMPGVTISRDHESRTIVFRFHAVDAKAADPRPLRRASAAMKKNPEDPALRSAYEALESALLDSVMPANPASWITREYILRQALSAKVMASDFLQLHAGVAADSQERWIDREAWNSLKDETEIPDGSRITVGVDCGLTHDSTAVVWAWKDDDSRVHLRSHVWCARPPRVAAAHEHVPGGRIRNEPVKDLVRTLAQRFQVDAVVYDKRFFEDAAQELSDEGVLMVELAQNGSHMRDAEQQFHDAILEGMIRHDGDAVLTAHVAATVADRVGDNWRIRKVKQSMVIDAVVAAIMAHYHARRLVVVEAAFAWG